MFKIIIILMLGMLIFAVSVLVIENKLDVRPTYDPTPCLEKRLHYLGYHNDTLIVCQQFSPDKNHMFEVTP